MDPNTLEEAASIDERRRALPQPLSLPLCHPPHPSERPMEILDARALLDRSSRNSTLISNEEDLPPCLQSRSLPRPIPCPHFTERRIPSSRQQRTVSPLSSVDPLEILPSQEDDGSPDLDFRTVPRSSHRREVDRSGGRQPDRRPLVQSRRRLLPPFTTPTLFSSRQHPPTPQPQTSEDATVFSIGPRGIKASTARILTSWRSRVVGESTCRRRVLSSSLMRLSTRG